MSKRHAEPESLLEIAARGDHTLLKQKLLNLPDSENLNDLVDEKGQHLLHLSVESESLECVRTVLRFADYNKCAKRHNGNTALSDAIQICCEIDIIKSLVEYLPELINIKGECFYPINDAIYSTEDLNVLKLIVETAKKNNILLSDYIEMNELNSLHQTVRFARLDALQYLIENTSFDVRKKNSLDQNAFQMAVEIEQQIHILYPFTQDERRIEIPLFLDYLYPLTYGDINCLPIELVGSILVILEDNEDDEEIFEWFVENIYLHECNEFKSTVSKLKTLANAHEINVNKLIFHLHSSFRGCMPRIVHKNSLRTTMFINLSYNILFIIFMLDKNLFHEIQREILMWNDLYRESEDYNEITFSSLLLWERICEKECHNDFTIEYFNEINLEKFNVTKCLRNFTNDNDFFVLVPCMMPFIAQPSADVFIDQFLERVNVQEAFNTNFHLIENYCGHSYNKEPMTLQVICRINIRQRVFESNRHLSNDEKLNKLKTLDLPVIVKNFLFYNYSRYNLFAKSNAINKKY